MNRIQTFWCEPSDRANESLRRYASSSEVGSCAASGMGYHAAEVALGEVAYSLDPPAYNGETKDDVDHADPRWPTQCACGYAFTEADKWQHRFERKYRRLDTGEMLPLDKLPAGASYDCEWHRSFGVGADGISLTVVLPDGTHWNVDGPATNDKKPWQREGSPRACNVTANPSIASPGYHGFLRSGWLEQC